MEHCAVNTASNKFLAYKERVSKIVRSELNRSGIQGSKLMFVLLMVVIGTSSAPAISAPLGKFSTLENCQAASNQHAVTEFAGEGKTNVTGYFVCVRASETA